jgi:hypothetical protein
MQLVLLAGLMHICSRYDNKSDVDVETLDVNIRLKIM